MSESPDRRSPRWLKFWSKETPRPFVAFAATDEHHAKILYRAQNIVWVWIGVASMLSAVAYVVRPSLGPVLVTHSKFADAIRELLVAVGGFGISVGVWRVRRPLEILGHMFFASGIILTGIATTIMEKAGVPAGAFELLTTFGLAAASAFRVYFIIRWIGSDR